ncbi:MAG: hypothetical protein AAFO01_02435 [Pseudomonadota bacterium]
MSDPLDVWITSVDENLIDTPGEWDHDCKFRSRSGSGDFLAQVCTNSWEKFCKMLLIAIVKAGKACEKQQAFSCVHQRSDGLLGRMNVHA